MRTLLKLHYFVLLFDFSLVLQVVSSIEALGLETLDIRRHLPAARELLQGLYCSRGLDAEDSTTGDTIELWSEKVIEFVINLTNGFGIGSVFGVQEILIKDPIG